MPVGRYSKVRDLRRVISENAYVLKDKKVTFKAFESICKTLGFNISEVTIAKHLKTLDGHQIDKITVKILREEFTFYKASEPREYTKTVTLGVHFDPPGEEGYWPLAPVVRFWLESNLDFFLQGELLRRWETRPQLPLIRTFLRRFRE